MMSAPRSKSTPEADLDPFSMPTDEIDALILESILSHSTDHVFFKDRQSRFVRVSNGLLKHFGAKRMEDILGKTDADFFAPDHARPALEDECRVIATGQPMRAKIEREVWPDNRISWASTTKLPWRNHQGEIIGIFGISRDITREHSLTLELEKKTQQLETSNRELEQFAFIASHDLQEPLRMISGFVQLIQRRYEDQLDDKGREYIRFAVEGATRMRSLIEGLLQYSRVKKQGVAMQPVDCSLVFADVVHNLRVLIEETGAQMDIEGELPIIQGVPSQIAQVFQNLINNAIKFRSEGVEPHIKVSVHDEEDHVEIALSDNGIGIDPKYADRIFGMFQRLHTRQKYEGNGIGLAMAKRIMIHHGGDICLEGSSKQGACFRLTFPKLPRT